MQEQNYSEEKEKKIKRWLLISIFAICVVGAAVTAGIFIQEKINRNRAEQLLQQLAEQTQNNVFEPEPTVAEPTPEPTAEPVKVQWQDLTIEEKTQKLEEYFDIEIPEKEINFATLQEETNPDIYAWIYIPDTVIDYPVLQHPEDNSYYLNYNIDGSKGYPGCIYTENYNSKNFKDFNTVLYGHNMKNGTMFAGLHKFENSEYFAEHPYIYIYTQDEVYVYRLFAAYRFSNDHLLLDYPVGIESGFASYLEEALETCSSSGGCLDQEVNVTQEDRIVTLSTCVANRAEQRYLVQGVLLKVGEDMDLGSTQGEG